MGKMKTAPAARRINGRSSQAMPIVIRDKPPTFHWGWFSREDPRMHLQTVDRAHVHLHYKIWLENKGRRVIEPEAGIPAKVLKALQPEILKRRESIEAEWISFMIRSGWLKVRLAGTAITLYAYPNCPTHFERTIDLHDLIKDEETAKKVTPKDVVLNEEFAFLEIFPRRDEGNRVHEPLWRVLWEG